jgi:DNA-binding response OmpR family regulator
VLGRGQILVIGDEPAMASLLRSGLADEGVRVMAASDGIEGERLALADDVTLAVLDQTVSDSHWLDVLIALRRSKPDLPIIVLSARADVVDRIAAFDAGASDFLAKPFSHGELMARVRAQLRRAAWT